MKNAEALLAALEADSFARLKWRVLALLGVCPLSLRARLTTRSRVLRLACHLALDAGGRSATAAAGAARRQPRSPSPGGNAGENPNFDMARFTALGGLSDGV